MKYGFIYILLASFSGGLFLAYEIICSNLLQPFFGSSFYVWSAILSVSITSLAIGYFLVSRFEFKNKKKLLLIAAFTTVIYILLIVQIFPQLIQLFDSFSYSVTTYFLSIILIAIPGILSGLITPLVISFNFFTEAGKNAGTIYGLSTLTSLVFTVITGFFLIPVFNSQSCLFILTSPLLVCVFILVILQKKWLTFTVKISIFILVVYTISIPTIKTKAEIYSSNGMMGNVKILDIKQNEQDTRLMMVNGMGQTWINKKDNSSIWSYVNFVTVASGLSRPSPSILLIGLGGGILANQLSMANNTTVDAVEIDPRIAYCGKKYFGLNKNVNVFIDDGRHFIKKSEKLYDVIVFDVFNGDVAPSHLLSQECFHDVQNIMSPKGILIINFNGFENNHEGVASRVLYKTLIESGLKTYIVPTFEEEAQRNTIFISSNNELDIANSRFSVTLNGSKHNLKSFEANPKRWFTEMGPITDDYPIMELLNYRASLRWRSDFRELLKSKVSANYFYEL